MSKYKIHVSNLAIWIYEQYSDEIAAENLIDQYSNKIATLEVFPHGFRGVSIEHRGYEIHFFPFSNYNIFFIVRDDHKDVVILRVLHQLQDWNRILRFDNVYHFGGRTF